jgi:IS5 family transposase
MKAEGHLGRCYLKGTAGDAVNAILAAVGHNLRLILAWLGMHLLLILVAYGARSQSIPGPNWLLNRRLNSGGNVIRNSRTIATRIVDNRTIDKANTLQ